MVCTITNTRRKGSITVIKDLVPASDTGRFDLKVDADVVKAAAGDGDQGSKERVAPGDLTRSPRWPARRRRPDLTKYDRSIAGTTNGAASESGNGASLGGGRSNDAVVCTITNTRRRARSR